MAEETGARTYQSSTFTLLFTIPEHALELYNSVNGTAYTDPGLVTIRRLDAGIELSVRNDVSFFVSSVLNLYEHQSTYNPNMPYRLLQYTAKMYEALIGGRNIYGNRLIRLPEPRFAVFYTGERKQPAVEEMKLSDAYDPERGGEIQLELRCTVYNLNHPEVRRRFSRAVSLGGYLHFIDRVKELKGGKMLTEEMIDRAINECIEQGILAEFFREHRKEIKNTMIIDETYENRLRLERLENERERAELGEEYEKRLELERQENKRELGELSEEYEKRLELERRENEKRLELAKQEAERKAERQAVEVMKRTLGNLMETMQLTAEQAMDALLIPPEERQKYRG